ncbi:hypothetical protein N9772_05555 [Bacteroidia bacterium]|nr:hypothetical protein [Bacteroidia bacterium]
MSFNKPKWLLLGFILIFGVTFFSTYYPSANDLPRGIHQWAQADRLALCYRYVDGKSLTNPATLSIKTINGDVGVEFSVLQYLLAQVVKLGYPKQYLPFLYKFFTLSFFYLSLALLCARVLIKESTLIILLTSSIVFTSPILVYYGYNYLPDVWALSLVLYALNFFHKGLSKYIYAILLITGLSLFIKTSSGIYFIAIYGVYFLQNIRKPNAQFWLASSLFACIGIGVIYYDVYYVAQINTRLWSTVFLSSTMPVSSWDEFCNVLDTAWRFKDDYFTLTLRWFLLLIALGALLSFRKKSFTCPDVQLLILLAVGLLSITVLFGVQFMNHDYYVIGTIFPILIYGIFNVSARYLPYVHPTTTAILLGVITLFSFSEANSRYFERMSEVVRIKGNPENYAYKWLIGGEEKIAKWVSNEEYIYVCYVPEPNHSLVYFNRLGATFNTEEMGRDESPFWYYLKTIQPRCILVQSSNVARLIADQPTVLEIADKVYTDDKLTVFLVKQ